MQEKHGKKTQGGCEQQQRRLGRRQATEGANPADHADGSSAQARQVLRRLRGQLQRERDDLRHGSRLLQVLEPAVTLRAPSNRRD